MTIKLVFYFVLEELVDTKRKQFFYDIQNKESGGVLWIWCVKVRNYFKIKIKIRHDMMTVRDILARQVICIVLKNNRNLYYKYSEISEQFNFLTLFFVICFRFLKQ